jgi:hypothetical protein
MAERSEILSDAEVDFLLSGEQQEAPMQAIENQAVTMRGDLEQIQLADVFQTLAMTKMEGVLRIRNPLEERQAHCRDGYLRLHVPGRLLARRLGQRLVNAGLCAPEALRSALVQQRKDRRPLGLLLVESGIVSQETVDEIVADQVAEDMFALFTWRHGSFEFWKGEPHGELHEVLESCPEYEINSLLLEVARRSDEWNTILDTIGSLDEVPARLADVPEDGSLGDLHLEILRAVDGHASYRELADRTTAGLFDAARAARDLVRMRIVGNVPDPAMVAVAQRFADNGNGKRALMTLQTLHDRPGDRPVGILQGMAACLQSFGERKLASSLLLEAAQRHTDSESALALARAARKLEPHDVGVLSFLRTILIAHAPATSPELEQCTTDLLDALIAADKVPVALDIIEDARRTNTLRPAILLREARARQKSRDLAGATTVLEELARLHEMQGEMTLANEAYDALLRIDRSRRDIAKLLTTRRRSRTAKFARVAGAATLTLMVVALGGAIWSHQSHLADLAEARTQVTEFVAKEDAAGAAASFAIWQERLGPCETIDDLSTQVAYVQSLQQARKLKQKRQETSQRLSKAAEALGLGDVDAALREYREIAADPVMRTEASDVATTRLLSLAAELETATKAMQARTLPSAKSLLDRRELLQASAELEAACPPTLRRAAGRLAACLADEANATVLTADLQQRLGAALSASAPAIAGAEQLAAEYAAALAKNERQRRLDPLFQRAVEREASMDFRSALAHYRELEQHSHEDASMREHFRERVARNATIVQLLDLLAEAAAKGDHATSLQHLRALRSTFPDVPFDAFARLPLRVESAPAGAAVAVNGKPVGVTPLQLERAPGTELKVEVALDGFQPQSAPLVGDEPAAWRAELALLATSARKHGSAIDAAPTSTPVGILTVDRAGNLMLVGEDGAPKWTFRTGDLSGCLTSPLMHAGTAVIGSVDGDLRAIDLATGALRWSVADLPMEMPPQAHGVGVVGCTSSGVLAFVGREGEVEARVAAPAAVAAYQVRADGSVLAVCANGDIVRVDLARRLHPVGATGLPSVVAAACIGDRIYCTDEHGTCVGLAADGQIAWRREFAAEPIGAPFEHGGFVWQTMRTGLARVAIADHRSEFLPGDEAEVIGAAVPLGDRMVVPTADGPRAHEVASGAMLYRLDAGRRARWFAVADQAWAIEPDHTIRQFSRMR